MNRTGLKITIGLFIFLCSCMPYYRYKLKDAKKNTKALDLSSSDYIVPPDDIFNFPHLEDIDLSNNPHLDWNATIVKLLRVKNLKTLILHNNPSLDIKEVVIGLSKVKNLKHLYIGENKITVLPEEIIMLAGLESIGLDNNPNLNIGDVIGKLSELKSLKFISAGNCGINELPEGLLAIKTLNSVHFYGNNLDELPDLSRLHNIQSIDIGGNKFKSIPACITRIKNRINFYAQSNQISTIPNEIASMKFTVFNMSNNPLPPVEREKIRKLVKARYKFY